MKREKRGKWGLVRPHWEHKANRVTVAAEILGISLQRGPNPQEQHEPGNVMSVDVRGQGSLREWDVQGQSCTANDCSPRRLLISCTGDGHGAGTRKQGHSWNWPDPWAKSPIGVHEAKISLSPGAVKTVKKMMA